MKFRIVYADRAKDAGLDRYIAELSKRISALAKLEEVFVDMTKLAKLPKEERVKAETERLFKEAQAQEYTIALSEGGEGHSSADFAEFIRQLTVRGHSRFVFIVGGAYGLDESIRTRAKAIISLSPLTFTSQLARAVLVEQLYRALSIIHGMPYHKD